VLLFFLHVHKSPQLFSCSYLVRLIIKYYIFSILFICTSVSYDIISISLSKRCLISVIFFAVWIIVFYMYSNCLIKILWVMKEFKIIILFVELFSNEDSKIMTLDLVWEDNYLILLRNKTPKMYFSKPTIWPIWQEITTPKKVCFKQLLCINLMTVIYSLFYFISQNDGSRATSSTITYWP